MKKLIITILLFASMVLTLQSQSYKFIAMDRYYDTTVPIDSVLVHNMKTGEDEIYFTDSIYLETITSVEDYNSESAFKIYPNPVEDILNIDLNEGNGSTLIIADVTGKVHFKYDTQPRQKLSLNIAGLPIGAYNISYGEYYQKFIKSSATNGSEISIVSTESTYISLIKENEVQSQFDHRFTIYCAGFKPKSYYSEAITKDSIITLDMFSLPSSFDGKHIRFKLVISDAEFDIRNYHHNSPNESSNDTTNITIEFLDTLIYRNGRIKNQRGLELYPRHIEYREGSFDSLNLEFVLDTNNQNITSLIMSRSIKKNSYSEFMDELTYYDLNYHFKFNQPVAYDFNNNKFYFNVSLDQLETNLGYGSIRVEYRGNGCGGHRYNNSLINHNPSKSYIKIEIID